MIWELKYRRKGTNKIKVRVIDLSFEKRNEVVEWWNKQFPNVGYDKFGFQFLRVDFELVGVHDVEKRKKFHGMIELAAMVELTKLIGSDFDYLTLASGEDEIVEQEMWKQWNELTRNLFFSKKPNQ